MKQKPISSEVVSHATIVIFQIDGIVHGFSSGEGPCEEMADALLQLLGSTIEESKKKLSEIETDSE